MKSNIWPESCAGAVSLTFDDGVPHHAVRIAPLMAGFGIRGTFYVNPNDAWLERVEDWRAAYAAGHEIGNHTVGHPCSCNHGWRARGLEEMTLEDIEEEIRRGCYSIRRAIPDQKTMSFCYPCYESFVGRGPTRQSYVPVVTRYHAAARGGGEDFNRPDLVDLHYVWSYDCRRMSGAELIGLCEQAAAGGGWAVLTFHGIGEAHHIVGNSDFRTLCDHLVANRARIWTAPFWEVAQRIQEARSS